MIAGGTVTDLAWVGGGFQRLPEVQTGERVFHKAQNVSRATALWRSASGPAHLIWSFDSEASRRALNKGKFGRSLKKADKEVAAQKLKLLMAVVAEMMLILGVGVAYTTYSARDNVSTRDRGA
jgi:hypothetical protein